MNEYLAGVKCDCVGVPLSDYATYAIVEGWYDSGGPRMWCELQYPQFVEYWTDKIPKNPQYWGTHYPHLNLLILRTEDNAPVARYHMVNGKFVIETFPQTTNPIPDHG